MLHHIKSKNILIYGTYSKLYFVVNMDGTQYIICIYSRTLYSIKYTNTYIHRPDRLTEYIYK